MVKMLTAQTLEIDDVEFAVDELLSQLQLDTNLKKNSVGLVTCYSEFIDSGVLSALVEALPFDIIGATTLGNASGGTHSLMMLSITVLTSDEVVFAASYSDSLAGEQQEPLRDMYEHGKAKLGGEPEFMLTCLPLLYHIGGDETIAMLDEISGGVPIFGTTTVDHHSDYHTAQTFLNADASMDRMAIIMMRGGVAPKFLVAQLSEGNILKQQALITKSKSNVLMEVNEQPVIKYMESLGIASDGKLDDCNSVPFVIDLGDGTPPIVRAIFAFTPEGYAVCGGVMPVNATLSIGSIDHADVIKTTSSVMKQIAAMGEHNCVLMFSCIARFLALGVDSEAEMERIEEMLPGGLPYQFSYAGGEICPVYDAEGKPHSRYHNDTLVVCVF